MLKGPHELRDGECYFDLLFYHPDTDIPCIDTYVYIGKNVENRIRKSSDDRWYFQDPESYLKHGSFVSFSKRKRIKHTVILADEDLVCHMYDLDGLIQALNELREGKR